MITQNGEKLMKNILLATAAVLVATTAYATDLPKKKKAPAAPAVATVSAPAAVLAAASVDSLTVAYGQDTAKGDLGSKTDDIYQLTYSHKLGNGFSVGGMAQTTQVPDSQLNQNLEAQVGYALPAFSGVTVSGKVGVGEKFTTTNFGYYALYGAADYKVTDSLTLNAVSYRYRSAFDTDANGYQSHQIGTGVTYAVAKNYDVSAKVYRNYDKDFDATGDQFMVGVTAKF